MKFSDIPRFSPPNYHIHAGWNYLRKTLETLGDGLGGVDMNPEFQRGYVWTPEQQTAYIEFCLMGGISGHDIYFNCPGWQKDFCGPMQIVDGKQRLSAVLDFMDGKVPVFGGHPISDFDDKPDILRQRFSIYVNDLSDPIEVVRWYLALNTGGAIHTTDEIERVRRLLERLENEKRDA